jgi:hypothetical protein
MEHCSTQQNLSNIRLNFTTGLRAKLIWPYNLRVCAATVRYRDLVKSCFLQERVI